MSPRAGEPVRSPATLRRAGRIMIGVGLVGVVVLVVGTIVAWRLAGELNDATTESLDVTIEALAAVDDSIDLADDVVSSTGEALDGVEDTLAAVDGSFGTATEVIDEIEGLTAVVTPALDDSAATLRRLEGIGSTVDDVLGGLSAVPFGPDYDPDTGLGPTFGRLADDVGPLVAALGDTSEGLGGLATSLDDLRRELDGLVVDVAAVNAELAGSDELVERYRASAGRAAVVAVAAREDLDGDVALMRLLIVVAGATFVVAQIVPLWMGRELLERSRRHRSAGTGE